MLFWQRNSYEVTSLPYFPQNKRLVVQHSTGAGENKHVIYHDVAFIPVLNKPLSPTDTMQSNLVEDIKESEEPDHHDIYQQFEKCPGHWRGFHAKSVASGGFPLYFLRRKGWTIQTSIPRNFILDEAPGLDTDLRARLPEFNFSVLNESSNLKKISAREGCLNTILNCISVIFILYIE
ncbi:hypothetical protein SLEP1_g4434 [Rubroshorea leprosula]|uniref:Uncharacterized protein n=1 Tax=Rubroshorea leprosula TaxID=152421 RepID=A0AAV5HYG3_9ROSI|nr:hypothetical protein SLEP1_g4434 [Rubroshorea leprosula]